MWQSGDGIRHTYLEKPCGWCGNSLRLHKRRRNTPGNPVIDALQMTREHARGVARDQFSCLDSGLRTVLVTAHRRENHGEPLVRICRAVARLTEQYLDVQVIWPVHPNPHVFETV